MKAVIGALFPPVVLGLVCGCPVNVVELQRRVESPIDYHWVRQHPGDHWSVSAVWGRRGLLLSASLDAICETRRRKSWSSLVVRKTVTQNFGLALATAIAGLAGGGIALAVAPQMSDTASVDSEGKEGTSPRTAAYALGGLVAGSALIWGFYAIAQKTAAGKEEIVRADPHSEETTVASRPCPQRLPATFERVFLSIDGSEVEITGDMVRRAGHARIAPGASLAAAKLIVDHPSPTTASLRVAIGAKEKRKEATSSLDGKLDRLRALLSVSQLRELVAARERERTRAAQESLRRAREVAEARQREKLAEEAKARALQSLQGLLRASRQRCSALKARIATALARHKQAVAAGDIRAMAAGENEADRARRDLARLRAKLVAMSSDALYETRKPSILAVARDCR